MLRVLSGLRNYLRVFGVLIADFVGWRPFALTPVLMVAIIAGGIYPVPFVIVVATIFSFLGNQDSVSIDFISGLPDLPLMYAIGIAIGAGALAYLLDLWASNRIIRLNLGWQSVLYARIVKDIGAGARLDVVQPVYPVRPRSLLGAVTNSVRAAALIGRLLSHGLYNATIILIAFFALIWLRWEFLAVAAAVALPFLPIYAHELRNIIKVRRELDEKKPAIRDEAELYLQAALSTDVVRDGDPAEPDVDTARFEPLYGIMNNQYFGINRIHFWSSVHIFLTLAALFLTGRSLGWELGTREGLALVVILLAVRAGGGLIGLMANITRNYMAIELLRRVLSPDAKPVAPAGARTGIAFRLDAGDAGTFGVKPGDTIFFSGGAKPGASIHLAWLANHLRPTVRLDASRIRVRRFDTRSPDLEVEAPTPPVLFLVESEYRAIHKDPAHADRLARAVVLVWTRDRQPRRITRYDATALYVERDGADSIRVETLGSGQATPLSP